MRKAFFSTVFIFILLFSYSLVFAKTGFGIRGGWVQNYENNTLKSSSILNKDISKEMPMVGAHLNFEASSSMDVEFFFEYAWKKKKVTLDGDVLSLKTDLTLKDYSLNATLKYKFPLKVIKPYAGAGVGWHRLVYDLPVAIPLDSEAPQLLFPEDENRWALHAVAGVALDIPFFPFGIFAEGKYVSVQTQDKASNYTLLLAGITFGL